MNGLYIVTFTTETDLVKRMGDHDELMHFLIQFVKKKTSPAL